jgi:HAD superfamily hydrolase (TIGR01490 family)
MTEVVFFDIDNVLIRGQSQLYLVKFLFKNRLIKLPFLIRVLFWFLLYKLHIVFDIEQFRKETMLIFRGWELEFSKNFFQRFYREEISLHLINESIKIIEEHRRANREVVLISASIKEVADLIAKNLNLKHVIATNLKILNDKYTGEINGIVPYGLQKRILAEKFLKENGLEKVNIYVYADHITDKELLEIASKPCVVNPDRLLRRVSLKNNWPIMYLT